MQYMALIYTDPALTPPMGKAMNDDYFAYTRRVKEAGVMKAGDALQPVTTATSVRVRDGKVETTDGPFADTKEAFAGIFMLEVPDLDAALAWAEKCPAAHWGTVEIRPSAVRFVEGAWAASA